MKTREQAQAVRRYLRHPDTSPQGRAYAKLWLAEYNGRAARLTSDEVHGLSIDPAIEDACHDFVYGFDADD